MKIIKYMMQVLVVGSLLTSCVEDADVTAYLTEIIMLHIGIIILLHIRIHT